MRILAFVDIHGSMSALEKIRKHAEEADIVVCAGDITIFEQGLRHIIERLDSLSKKVLLIHGNHENPNVMAKLCSNSRNVVFIHDKVHIEKDFAFFGYGGGGFSRQDVEFEKASVKHKKHFAGKRLVLVTHAPPYNTKVDNILGEPCGSRSILKFLQHEKPELAVCGHLHENAGKDDTVGKTYVINPGPFGKLLVL